MNQKAVNFVLAQTVASVCINDNRNRPYCFSCFYAVDNSEQLLFFKTSRNSFHGQLLQARTKVAGIIQQDKLNRLSIQGIQFSGEICEDSDEIVAHAKKYYYDKFPFAIAIPGEIFTIRLNWVKFTDNTLGFGTKQVWEREPEYAELSL